MVNLIRLTMLWGTRINSMQSRVY